LGGGVGVEEAESKAGLEVGFVGSGGVTRVRVREESTLDCTATRPEVTRKACERRIEADIAIC